MGREARCRVTYQGRTVACTAQLETTELRVRGVLRHTIPFADIVRIDVDGGDLRVLARGDWTTLSLGAEAGRWAERIRSPRGLLDKLGVRAGHRVVLIAVPDGTLHEQLEARGATVTTRLAVRGPDLVFLGATTPGHLDRLSSIRDAIAPAGAAWVIWPKGRAELKEDHVRAAALASGLVDVKVVAFSDTHSALKLVVPRAAR